MGFATPKLTSSFAEFYHTLCVTCPPQEHLSKIMILYGTLWMIEPTCILIIYVVLLPVDRGVITQGAHYFVTLLIIQCTYPFQTVTFVYTNFVGSLTCGMRMLSYQWCKTSSTDT